MQNETNKYQSWLIDFFPNIKVRLTLFSPSTFPSCTVHFTQSASNTSFPFPNAALLRYPFIIHCPPLLRMTECVNGADVWHTTIISIYWLWWLIIVFLFFYFLSVNEVRTTALQKNNQWVKFFAWKCNVMCYCKTNFQLLKGNLESNTLRG